MSLKVQVKMSENGKYAHPGQPRKPALEVKAGEIHEFNPDQAQRICKAGNGKMYYGEPEPEAEVAPPPPPPPPPAANKTPSTKDKSKAQGK